jgi:hypothetical protein
LAFVISALDAYIAAGWDLIPLNRWDYRDRFDRERGKSPRDANWRMLEYRVDDVVHLAHEGYNVGVRLREGDLVIDFDPRNLAPGENSAAVLMGLELEFGLDLARCPSTITGSGGRHWYMRRQPLGPIRNRLAGFSDAIEFKSVGRQVVAAGSKHPNGQQYEWAPGHPPLVEAPEAPEALQQAILRPSGVQGKSGEPGAITPAELAECLAQIPVTNYNGKHEDWLQLMMAAHSGTNGAIEGREVFVEWSTGDPAYADEADDIRYRWESFEPNASGGVTVATLYHHVIEAGGRPPRPDAKMQFEPIELPPDAEDAYVPLFDVNDAGVPKNTGNNALEAIKWLGIMPERDVFRDKVVLRGDLGLVHLVYPEAREVADDRLIYAIWRLCIQRWRLELSQDKIISAVESIANEHQFDCVREFFEALPEWDGKKRIDTWLTDYAGAVDTPYVRATGRMLLLGCVGRIFHPGIKFDNMVVIEGPQGCGKSTLIRDLGGEWALEGLPTQKDSDVIAAMQGRWIIEMAELDAMRRQDVSSLKAFLARTEDRARMAYARMPRDFPRRCVFVGTTNDAGYLRDRTGNRRFFPVAVTKIDRAAILRDRNQLWAEAYAAWLANPTEEALMFPPHLYDDAAAQQEERMAPDPLEIVLEEFFAKQPDLRRVTTSKLAWDALHKSMNALRPGDLSHLSEVMARLGWRAVRFREEGVPRRGFEREQS